MKRARSIKRSKKIKAKSKMQEESHADSALVPMKTEEPSDDDDDLMDPEVARKEEIDIAILEEDMTTLTTVIEDLDGIREQVDQAEKPRDLDDVTENVKARLATATQELRSQQVLLVSY